MKARVYVTLRTGILDPQGRAVQKTLGSLGFSEVADVRVGKYIELELKDSDDRNTARQRVEDMCQKLLVNPVIEDYRVHIGDSAEGVEP